MLCQLNKEVKMAPVLNFKANDQNYINCKLFYKKVTVIFIDT